jgi:hypothetical protein
MEEVCPSLPSWMKPTMKEEKILNEGLEKASRNLLLALRLSSPRGG